MGDASQLNNETLPWLQSLVEEYPYFQTARMLYLKNLAMLNNVQFGDELKRTAISTPDRKKLYSIIEEAGLVMEEFNLDQSEEADDSFSLIEQFLHDKSGNIPDPALVLRPSASLDYLSWAIPVNESTGESATSPELAHGNLIDAFLKEDKIRSGNRWLDAGDLTEYAMPDSVEQLNQTDGLFRSTDDSSFTETLATIYAKQKRYEKALEIIQNLSLKYPEKNVYFADQIRFLEKLIINSKKEN
jgi:hypothetical protein